MKKIVVMPILFLTLMLVAGPTHDEQITPQFTGIRKAVEQTVLIEVTIVKTIRKRNGSVDIQRSKRLCSGVVIERNKVLTCAHSIERLDPITETPFFKVNGRNAKVLKRDFNRDLILLRTSQIFKIEPVLISKRKLELLETVVVCGHPMGMMKTAFERNIIGFMEDYDTAKRYFFMVDGTLFQGTSGGPVFNEDWELVGTVCHGKYDANGAVIGVCADRESILDFLNEDKDAKK